MRVRRSALPVDNMPDVDGRRNQLFDGLQHPQHLPGWGGSLDTDVGQRPIQSPPTAPAVGVVIQLCHNLPVVAMLEVPSHHPGVVVTEQFEVRDAQMCTGAMQLTSPGS